MESRFDVEDAPEAALTLRRLVPLWPLALVLAATFVAYAPSLNSPLYGDDYIYLVAAREWSFTEYVQVAFTPWGDEPTFTFTRDFWRPLAFTWFEVAEPVFGGEPLPYHLVNLGIHLASTVLVWLLATRLDARPVVRAVATLVFALYPGSFEAVTWISSVNSAGLPFALGAWLAFLAGTRREPVGWGMVGLSAALVGVGLMFRESAIALLPAMGLWFLLVQRRDRAREWRTYLPILPFVAVGLAYGLVRTRLLTEPLVNSDIYKFDSEWPERWWFYAQNAWLPFRDPVTGWRDPAQDIAGIVLLAIPLLAAWRRRWDVLALSLGLIVSTVPYGAAVLGVGQRYFYFSTPVLAVLAGVLAADLLSTLERQRGLAWNQRRRAAGAGVALGLAVLGGSAVTYDRIAHWIDIAPERQQQWVDGLRATYPDLPPGGTLYCSNVPLILAVFGGANLDPTVRWYYPDLERALLYTEAQPPVLQPDDRWYNPGPAP